MIRKLEYDKRMKRLNRASVAGFAVLVWVFVLLSSALAQINGAPPSVTSIGFGGNPGSIHGVAPSVTSLGPRGYTPGYSPFPQGGSLFGVPSGHNINGHRHPHGSYYGWGGGYYYAVPYYGYGYYDDNGSDDAAPEDQYNGGPTVFDRRGPGQVPRPPAVASSAPVDQPGPAGGPSEDAAAPLPEPAQPETVLIFKDGHQLEVENYAIVGSTLYDLTEGRKHKIALDDLDLTATAKQNEDRGVDFQIPATPAAN
jgi:hypothetical protein